MISVHGAEKLGLVEIEAFLSASESVRFVSCGRMEIYSWVERLLCHHEYPLQGRRSNGLLRAYAEHLTGLSRAQSTRLSGAYVKAGRIAPKPSLRPRFQRHYTADDVELLASVDRAHERLSGQATHPSGQRPSAGDTSRRPTPRPSTSSTPASSTPTSTTTGPRPRPKSRSTTKAANGASTSYGKRRWKNCSRWTARNSSCAPDSASTR